MTAATTALSADHAGEQPGNAAGGLAPLTRAGRSLIGWMAPQEAQLSLAGRRMDHATFPPYIERAAKAREAAEKRLVRDVTGAVAAAPSTLGFHIAHMRNVPAVRSGYFDVGFEVELVDLTLVAAMQPFVGVDHARDRVADAVPDDMESIAAVSLPIPVGDTALPINFDEGNSTLSIMSRNPNLRILGPAVVTQDGVPILGFVVNVLPSYLQVVAYHGRYFLRDGYHRALGFLMRGINVVPAFVREVNSFAELSVGVGMLPQDSYLGDHPPYLPDYLDDTVSADVRMPVTQKVVMVQ
jgi:hypothetical protein